MTDLLTRLQPFLTRIFEVARRRCFDCRSSEGACDFCPTHEILEAFGNIREELHKECGSTWGDAAYWFYVGGLQVNWERLGEGVTYARAAGGLYVVRETDGDAPWRNQTFSFYQAEDVEGLRRLYYGANEE
jgi:hypothetical protein